MRAYVRAYGRAGVSKEDWDPEFTRENNVFEKNISDKSCRT